MSNMVKVTAKEIAKMIDHSLLKPQMTIEEVREGAFAPRNMIAPVCA